MAHRALVNFELQLPFRVLIVTQNIDDLHERAGNQNLIHMHGELRKSRCAACDEVRPKLNDLDRDAVREHCVGKGTMRPQVVWFGQELLEQDPIGEALSLCELFLSIGTSGSVYAAAGFVQKVKILERKHTVDLSLEPSFGESQYEERHYGQASEIVP